jgi:protein phosphatase 2C-like protein
MWKAIYDSVVGTSHSTTGQPCQDVCRVDYKCIDGEELLLVVCADGAGSARCAQQGANTACEEFLRIVNRDITGLEAFKAVDRSVAISWCNEIRSALQAVSVDLAQPLRDFASTFLAVLLCNDSRISLQVGDGAIVLSADGSSFDVEFWPQSGEYINVTNFLTDERFADSLAFKRLDGVPIRDCAVFTDGLERLALHFATLTAHAPFFRPLFARLRQPCDTSTLKSQLRTFLDSTAVNERTDDDKTLVLVTNMNADDNGRAIH